MGKRTPSAMRTAKGLDRLAAEVEHRATLVRELGNDSHARALDTAARAIGQAADAMYRLAAVPAAPAPGKGGEA